MGPSLASRSAERPLRVLVTGVAGFIGSHLAEAILKGTDWTIIGLDRLDETSTLHRIGETDAYRQRPDRLKFVWHDLRAAVNDLVAAEIGPVDAVLHLAASTHVDRSITDPFPFIQDNVIGTYHLLEFARRAKPLRVVYFSTDEVFGPAPPGAHFSEWDRYRSSNPYSATKAAGEELAIAYHNTYGVPVFITHTMNVIGERQNVEKFLPLLIRKILAGDKVIIHADETKTEPASRGYVHARNVASALLFLLEHAVPGDKYNIGGQLELNGLELATRVAAILGRPLNYELVNFHSQRPGHDLRYGLDASRLRDMGFTYPKSFDDSLEKCVRWYVANPKWLGL